MAGGERAVKPAAPERDLVGPRGRRTLPPRRLALREKIAFAGERGNEIRIYVTAGFDPETLDLLEVFIRPRGNVDTDLCRYFDDVGVLISRCLQFGDAVEAMADGMGRLPGHDGRRAHSPIGAIVDALAALSRDIRRTGTMPLERAQREAAAP